MKLPTKFISEVQADREAERKIKKRASFLAASLKERDRQKAERSQPPRGGKPRTPLAKDQGAYCKEEGHWKNECPNRGKAPRPSRCWEEPHGERLTGLPGADSD